MKKKEEVPIQYSQNFLVSDELVTVLLNKTSININDIVYEIGPGNGIITKKLYQRSAQVIAIEKDSLLYDKLRIEFSENENVNIINDDFLQISLPSGKYKVFANIPFSITADVIAKLTEDKNPPLDIYLIVQKEAAKKYAGNPYGDERLRSLQLKPWFQFIILHYLKRSDFLPIPSSDSVLLQIKKRNIPLISNEESQKYFDFIAYAFTNPKSSVERTLKKLFSYEQLKRLGQDLQFNLSSSLISLSFEQWLGLYRYFLKGVDIRKQLIICNSYTFLKQQQEKMQKIHRTRPDRKMQNKIPKNKSVTRRTYLD